jgi:GTP-binding protein
MSSYLEGYEPYRGDFPSRNTGSLVADRQGDALAYALFNLEPRGELLITPGTPVYTGMIVGIHSRDNDLNVNVCKGKKLTNMRASGRDENVNLTPVPPMSLERALDLIRDDEMVEITPKNIRLRKLILDIAEREKHQKKMRQATAIV